MLLLLPVAAATFAMPVKCSKAFKLSRQVISKEKKQNLPVEKQTPAMRCASIDFVVNNSEMVATENIVAPAARQGRELPYLLSRGYSHLPYAPPRSSFSL